MLDRCFGFGVLGLVAAFDFDQIAVFHDVMCGSRKALVGDGAAKFNLISTHAALTVANSVLLKHKSKRRRHAMNLHGLAGLLTSFWQCANKCPAWHLGNVHACLRSSITCSNRVNCFFRAMNWLIAFQTQKASNAGTTSGSSFIGDLEWRRTYRLMWGAYRPK